MEGLSTARAKDKGDGAGGQGSEGNTWTVLIRWLQREMQNNMKTTKTTQKYAWIFFFFVEPGERTEFCIKVCMKLERIPCRQGEIPTSGLW